MSVTKEVECCSKQSIICDKPFMVHYSVVENLYEYSGLVKALDTKYMFDEAMSNKTWPIVSIPICGLPVEDWNAFDYILHSIYKKDAPCNLFDYYSTNNVTPGLPINKKDMINFVDFFMIGESLEAEKNFRFFGLKVMDRLWFFAPLVKGGTNSITEYGHSEEKCESAHEPEGNFWDYDDEEHIPSREWYSADETAKYDLEDGAKSGKGRRRHFNTMIKRAAKLSLDDW